MSKAGEKTDVSIGSKKVEEKNLLKAPKNQKVTGLNKKGGYSPNKTQTNRLKNDFYKTLSEIDNLGNENNVSEKISQNFLILKDQYFEDVRKNLMKDTYMPYLKYSKDTDPNNYKWFSSRTKSSDNANISPGRRKETNIEKHLRKITHSTLPSIEKLKIENKQAKRIIKNLRTQRDHFLTENL